jgi:excinuclease ABC subunit C
LDGEKLKELQERSKTLPLTPGVYIMKDKSGHIIYIGKAKALRRRVSQYFLRYSTHTGKVKQMVSNVDRFEYILTDSEFEALVLECSLIKQHRPKYNILLKDDKGYSYIRVTLSEEWPRITAVKQKNDDGAVYLGPYISSFAVREAVDEAVRAFELPTCTRRFPQEIGRGRPCLNYYIHQCAAPCRGRMKAAEYRESVDEAVTFLRGGYNVILRQLGDQMAKESEALEFEKAAKLRDRIAAIKKIRERQKVVSSRVAEQDVIALDSDGCGTAAEVFIIRGGRLTDRDSFVLDLMPDTRAGMAEFIRRYYSGARVPPRQVTLDCDTEDRLLLEQYLTGLAGRKVLISVPQKGEQAALADMAKENAREKLLSLSVRPGREEKALAELGGLLGTGRPGYIEAYDISHLAGTGMVAGMVVFEDGRPLRSAYRRFSIKTVVGQDDYACMREVVSRRLARLRQAEDETGEGAERESEVSEEGFGRRPDLILLDGGRGHVSAVRPVLEEMGFADIPLFGMVKDDRHRTRAIARDGGEIQINSSRAAFTLVSDIQEEVHRYAISYHNTVAKKKGMASKLTDVPGIGSARAKALMKYFKTLSRLRAASADELAEVPGMNKKAAQALREYLNGEYPESGPEV